VSAAGRPGRVRAVLTRALVTPALAAACLLSASAASAAPREWYEFYFDARDRYIPAKRWADALAALQEATRLKPESGLDERTYGMEFVDYFPYFYEGQCHLALGEFDSAQRLFNIEESKRQITRRPALWRELRKLRADAQASQVGVDTAEKVRRLGEQVTRLEAEAASLHKEGKYDEALARLATAQSMAKILDQSAQARVAELTQRIRDDKSRADEARTRSTRIDKAMADGLKLLQDGRPAEAKLQFEAVLALEADHAAALDGKRRAETDILASTTRATREALLREGRTLYEAARYEEAMRPLAEAAADQDAQEAQDLLAKARRYVEGVQSQREKRARVDGLMAAAARFLGARRWPEAYVQLGSVLEIEPDNAKAREQYRTAGRLAGEEVLDRIFPNSPPLLSFLVPSGEGKVVQTSTEAQRIEVVGAVIDDRGVAKLQYLLNGAVVAEQDLLDPVTGDLPRKQQVRHTFELAKGSNQIKVVALDSGGKSEEQTFLVTRNLLLTERPWFLPSAVATSAALIGLGYAAQRTRRRRAVRNRFNPYIAGAPVLEDDMFFGRQKLLARIMNVLHHNSLMITGERRIGKTTLLHHLRKALESDQGTEYQFFPVSTDLQGVPESGFFEAVMADALEQLSLRPETTASLRYSPDAGAPYDGRDFSHDLQRVVQDLIARTPKKVKLALLIDEVDVLNEYSERVNQRLRSIFMKTFSEHLVAIMSGVGIKRIWKSEGSPWYNFFDEIELTAFTREEAEALVRQPVEGVFRWRTEAVEAILSYSALKPYVIQKFCIHAVNHMLEAGRTTITAADVEAVRPGVLFERPEEIASVPETASA
jgi:AAA ATPase-like protein